MADTIRVLIVEDDESTIEDWRRAIELHNAEPDQNHFTIEAQYPQSYADAAMIISAGRFDAAVVDLRLKDGGTGGHNEDGNRVTKLLSETAVAAIAIFTGQPGEAEQPALSPQIEIFEKGGGLDPVMQWLLRHRRLAVCMQGSIRAIEKDMAAIFHSSIWPRWRIWTEQVAADSSNELQAALTRHFVSHLHTALLESTRGKVHPEEWYFMPVRKSTPLSTGDLLKRDNRIEIVITPRCDLARDPGTRTKTVQLAKCDDISLDWETESQKGDRGKKALDDLRQHRKSSVQHFLPRMQATDGPVIGPWFVRFDQITSLPDSVEQRQELCAQRFATLTPEFVPSLVERLGAYFSRIGTPDVS